MVYRNVVIGKPLSEPWEFIALSEKDFEDNEREYTLFTETRYLPAVLKEAGIVASAREVRRNRPDLCVTFEDDRFDCLDIKIGKKRLWIVVGAASEDIRGKKLMEIERMSRNRTVKEIFSEFTESEKSMVYSMVGDAITFGSVDFDRLGDGLRGIYLGLDDDKREVADAIVAAAS